MYYDKVGRDGGVGILAVQTEIQEVDNAAGTSNLSAGKIFLTTLFGMLILIGGFLPN